LVARGNRGLREARLRWAIVFARGVWFKLIESTGLALDTRFVPPAPGPAKPNACLQLVLAGSWTTFGERHEVTRAPIGVLLSEEQMEGAERQRPFAFRTAGEPFVGIEVHLGVSELAAARELPAPIVLDDAARDAATRAATLSCNDDRTVAAALSALLEHLAATGIVRADFAARAAAPPPRVIGRLWAAVKPLVERLAVSATLDEVAELADLSFPQVEREIHRFLSTYGLVGPGLRSLTRHVRLKTAVVFLTARGASITEIAEVAGYGSTDAMARAFRDAGLPSPSAVQREIVV
jgi:AraC-like DNA-binding protein